MRLEEKYRKRLNISEQLYAKYNNGAVMSRDKKILTAQVLENQAKYLKETYGDNSVSTQRSDIGMMKKFCMDIATLTLPNLIAQDLMLTKPLTSFNGYITYYEYSKASNKGESHVGDLIVNPFKNGKVDPNYTSSTVIENRTIDANHKITLGWGPVVPGSVEFTVDGDNYFDDGQGHIFKGNFASKRFTAQEVNDGVISGQAGRFIVDTGEAVQVGTITYGYKISKSVAGAIYDDANPEITFTTEPTTKTFKVNYVYNNIAIAQHDLPYVTVQEKGIYVVAKARKIAIEYSQMAAFQYKQEYGENLGARLEQIAIHTLKYETDTEATDLLVNAAGAVDPDLVFNVTVPQYVSLSQHYEGFARKVQIGVKKVLAETQKFVPNYMLAGLDFLTVLPYCAPFKEATDLASVNGPFYYGTWGKNLKVYITPNMPADQYVLGVNGDDLGTSAAVFCPFMAITPTASLETPDGTNTKGYSSVYAMEILNKNLLIKGAIEEKPQVVNVSALTA